MALYQLDHGGNVIDQYTPSGGGGRPWEDYNGSTYFKYIMSALVTGNYISSITPSPTLTGQPSGNQPHGMSLVYTSTPARSTINQYYNYACGDKPFGESTFIVIDNSSNGLCGKYYFPESLIDGYTTWENQDPGIADYDFSGLMSPENIYDYNENGSGGLGDLTIMTVPGAWCITSS